MSDIKALYAIEDESTTELFGAKSIVAGSKETNPPIAADVDGDGDLDLISSTRKEDKVVWYENTNGLGHFAKERIISELAFDVSSVFASDLVV